ncbi:tyrosine-type recombinase/integrase [Bacillus mexicanus]|uniref:tyrosine-type recombinase/integrase n=1 Tax=Bacillus mexicanus TaxID=2834415 RepID=UPI003D1EA7F8
MKLTDTRDLYIQNLWNINLSERTISNYNKELGYFFDFLSTISIETITDIKSVHINMYIAHLVKKGNKAATRTRKKSVLKKFFEYCIQMELIEKDPSAVIGKIKVTDADKKKKEILTLKEQEKVLKAIDKKSTNKLKNICIFNLFIYCGIRVSELCGLLWEDIDFKSKLITIRGKGRKTRKVPLVKEVESDLKQLKKEQTPRSEYIFTAKKTGLPMSDRNVRSIISRYCESAKISKNISPHRLRATAATSYLREGVNMRYIQMLLGHSTMSTTAIYLNPEEQEMNDAVQSAARKIRKKGNKK